LTVVDEIVTVREDLREQARRTLGVEGEATLTPLRELRRNHQFPLYPVTALGLLAVADTFQTYAFTVLTPDISRALGISIGAIAATRALQSLAIAVSPLPVAALTQHRARRALLCVLTGVIWSVVTLFTGFVTSLLGLVFILTLDGLTTGSVQSLHAPLVMDSYHPAARVRAMSTYQALYTFGNVGGPLLVGLLAGVFGFTWRGVFLIMGFASLAIALFSVGLRDPGFGAFDTQQLRQAVHEHDGDNGPVTEADTRLGFWEICRRMLLIRTNKRIYSGFTVFGMLLIPLNTFLSFFLERRWDLGPGARGAFFSYFFACGVVALLVYGRRGERQFREDPAKMMRFVGLMLGVGVCFIALGGAMPVFSLVIICFGIGGACTSVLVPGLYIGMLAIIPANMRPHAQALAGIFIAIGGVVGSLLLSGVDQRYGVAGTMIAFAIPGIAGAIIIGSSGRFIVDDLDRMIDEVIEDEEIKRIRSAGGHLPMLACRGIDFSYGQLQVLFDVDFTVDDGEMVALLGVNGAGKSTLLKVVSGIGLPTRGSVRFAGQDVTYLDAERRLRIGITQIPGGRAVFGPMTVVENLRSFAFTFGADKRGVDRAIDGCFEVFPRLYDRRSSLASTLSGGEQQMLGLSKALMLKPRLLLIDELSLGLAPVIVGQLLEMVRRINNDGTAVVLVEQSVNIALNLVDHAYFMEKGEMRFDGRSADLLARDDLLRAVFLQGAAARQDL
jgi:ABC-type branched-subunit amino acid transport system ATPase component/MFS family permease